MPRFMQAKSNEDLDAIGQIAKNPDCDISHMDPPPSIAGGL